METNKDPLDELGLVVGTKQEAMWQRIEDNLKLLIEQEEMQLKEIPLQLEANKEMLNFVKEKTKGICHVPLGVEEDLITKEKSPKSPEIKG